MLDRNRFTLTARSQPGIFPASGVLKAWQSNDLQVRLLAPRGGIDFTPGVTYLHLEIHTTKTPAGKVPLTAKTIAAGSESTTSWDFDLTTEQMSFDIGTVASADRYLFITARDDDGEVLQTLAAAVVTIHAATYSGQAANPATVIGSLYLRVETLTLDEDTQTFWIFVGGKKFRLAPLDYQDA